MNEHALRVLEYDKMLEVVAAFSATPLGRSRIKELRPCSDRPSAAALLAETAECMALLEGGDHPPFDGVQDIREVVHKLAVSGMTLLPGELLATASTLAAARKLKKYFAVRRPAEGPRTPATVLAGIADRIVPHRELEDAVMSAIDETGEVKDSASPELRRIRKQLNRVRDEILDRLERILRRDEAQSMVQEPVITMRDDRYVLPLKPNFRQGLKGVVHGQSGSRQTLFVEPLDVLEQNNRLAELRMDEREERDRILRELTLRLAAAADSIADTLAAVATLDAVYARARFGVEYGATTPVLSDGRQLKLCSARHPLLLWKRGAGRSGADIIPNDVELGPEGRALIISGPNAGGKTVVLKTIGLLSLLAQSGIPVTASAGTVVPVFRQVYADIGDEQSLERDLSTFSSHARRLATILREAAADSLVLLDELGTGTDPAEGAALGAAALRTLIDRGCATVATTHHSALKLFGSTTPGAVSAAMELDPETLAPTFRFIPGRPGRSYGLDMAERLGVPSDVISDARARVGEREAALDTLLEGMQRDAAALRLRSLQAEGESAAARRANAEAQAARASARRDAVTVLANAKREARDALTAIRKKLRELSQSQVLSRDDAAARSREVEALARTLEPKEEAPPAPAAAYVFRPGDRVRLPRFDKTGAVVAVRRGTLEVEADGVTLRLPVHEAVPAEEGQRPAPTVRSSGWRAELAEPEGLPDRLHLLGQRVDEAIVAVDRFLDRAGAEGFGTVVIIHGVGTGALKNAVAKHLQGHPLVASIRPGEPSEGGAGVTVAELKR